MKTIVQCWQLKYSGYAGHFFGIGDIIRGTIYLHQFCLKSNGNFRLVVDIHKHPISNFLKKKGRTEYSEILDKAGDNIPFCTMDHNIHQFIDPNSEITIVQSNHLCDETLDNETKRFISGLFVPNKRMNQELKTVLVPQKFDIFHFRLADNNLICDFSQYDRILQKSQELSKNNALLLVANSSAFKHYAKTKYPNLIKFDTEPGHLGLEQNENKVKDTMFEFFIISKADKIMTHSDYPWVSGFVYWIAKVYDIPIFGFKGYNLYNIPLVK